MASLAGQNWNVYLKKAFWSPDCVLKYLARYTHRVGIANSRLLEVSIEQVTFRTKDGRKVSLHPVAFLKRFVQHVLPDGFKQIRQARTFHYRIFASFYSLAARSACRPSAPKATVKPIVRHHPRPRSTTRTSGESHITAGP